jgi:hypothetical protein
MSTSDVYSYVNSETGIREPIPVSGYFSKPLHVHIEELLKDCPEVLNLTITIKKDGYEQTINTRRHQRDGGKSTKL